MAQSSPTVVHPGDVREAADLLRAATADGASLGFRGSGTKQWWGATPDPVDLIVQTDAAASLVAHHPGDLTAVVQAGMRLDALQRAVAPSGQWLAIDPATEADGATIGGLLATGDAGPRRLRYGTMRDLAIGATLVLADGTIVHSGSHVIKNVAGYDLTKLFYRSFGALGLIGEVIVRLHPLPTPSATVVAQASAAHALEASGVLTMCGVALSAVEWTAAGSAGQGALMVRLDSNPRGAQAGLDRVQRSLERLGLPSERLSADAANPMWAAHAAATRARADESVTVAAMLPTRVGAAVDHVGRLAAERDVTVRVTSGVTLGLVTVAVSGAPQDQVDFLQTLRSTLIGLGGSVAMRDRPAAVDKALDAMGPPPPEVALLRAIHRQLDPHRRCAPGRFGSWY